MYDKKWPVMINLKSLEIFKKFTLNFRSNVQISFVLLVIHL